MKVLCKRSSVYVGPQALAIGVNDVSDETGKALIARGLVTAYEEPKVNKVEEKPADKPADKK